MSATTIPSGRSIVLGIYAFLGVIIAFVLLIFGLAFLAYFGAWLIPIILIVVILGMLWATRAQITAWQALFVVVIAFAFGWFIQQMPVTYSILNFFGVKLSAEQYPSDAALNQILALAAVFIVCGMAIYYSYMNRERRPYPMARAR